MRTRRGWGAAAGGCSSEGLPVFVGVTGSISFGRGGMTNAASSFFAAAISFAAGDSGGFAAGDGAGAASTFAASAAFAIGAFESGAVDGFASAALRSAAVVAGGGGGAGAGASGAGAGLASIAASGAFVIGASAYRSMTLVFTDAIDDGFVMQLGGFILGGATCPPPSFTFWL